MHEVEALERRGWEALSGPDGASFFEDLMTEEGLMVFPGLTLDKIATVGAIAGARPWSSHQLDDVRLVTTEDTAVITYHATAQREGEEAYGWWLPWDGAPTGDPEPFATGFLPNGAADALGRPAGLAVGADGALYVSDDKAGFIYRIARAGE